MSIRLSRIRGLFNSNPVQSFYPDAPMFRIAHAGHAPRQFQGLDMRKINDFNYFNVFKTRTKLEGGYEFGAYHCPSVHAFTPEEMVENFTNKNFFSKYTTGQILRSAFHRLRFVLLLLGNIVATVTPVLCFVFWHQYLEPMEVDIEPDEYYKYYKWHYYGPELDHHAYANYLEARRTKKWRDPSVDPEEYIPEKYKNLS